MKITDTLGRALAVDVVVKAPQHDMFMEPLSYKLENSGTQFLRVPNGPFALRVMSKLGADLLVHLNGKLVLRSSVAKGLHYLETDQDGRPFCFGVAEEPQAEHESEGTVATESSTAVNDTTSDGMTATEVKAPLLAPTGHGLLFVVARFADDPIYGSQQPPRQEFTLTFQLNAPQDHDRSLAGSLSRLVEPALPEESDAVIEVARSGRPTFTCSCTGCMTGKGHVR